MHGQISDEFSKDLTSLSSGTFAEALEIDRLISAGAEKAHPLPNLWGATQINNFGLGGTQ